MNNDRLEFDFGPGPCKCNENTKYDDLCPTCLTECLEWMQDNEALDNDNWEHG